MAVSKRVKYTIITMVLLATCGSLTGFLGRPLVNYFVANPNKVSPQERQPYVNEIASTILPGEEPAYHREAKTTKGYNLFQGNSYANPGYIMDYFNASLATFEIILGDERKLGEKGWIASATSMDYAKKHWDQDLHTYIHYSKNGIEVSVEYIGEGYNGPGLAPDDLDGYGKILVTRTISTSFYCKEGKDCN